MEMIIAIIGTGLGLYLVGWLYFWLPASMAEDRGRSAFGWVILTLFLSPVVTIIALLVLGPTVETAVA